MLYIYRVYTNHSGPHGYGVKLEATFWLTTMDEFDWDPVFSLYLIAKRAGRSKVQVSRESGNGR